MFLELIKSYSERVIPPSWHLRMRYNYRKFFRKLDAEMLITCKSPTQFRRFVDIGAHVGIYSFHYAKNFDSVNAFEPNYELLNYLKEADLENVRIDNLALSDTIGDIELNIPRKNNILLPAEASLEELKGDFETLEIHTDRLDKFQFSDVDLIKIDVEGHEENVIEGARETIMRCKPIMIIEIEQRHLRKPIQSVIDFIINFGYDGYFLSSGQLNSTKKFSYQEHQEPFLNDIYNDKYINNFIFHPTKHDNIHST